ncbi:MAG TPA: hypothetical protein VNA20_03370 [Frankiaceae bacterium]|nr:hypothetical protein [Frankiaceae bacterium]
MRKSIKRVLALGAATPLAAATLLVGAPAAHAATAPTCGVGSTVLADFYTLGGFHTRIATYDVTSTVTNVCIRVGGTFETVLVVKRTVSITPPSVSQTAGVGACATRIIDMTAPVALALSIGANTTGPVICLGQNGTTTTVTFNGPAVNATPDIDVWTIRGTVSNEIPCADEYARYVAGLGDYWDWYDCYYYSDHRIV